MNQERAKWIGLSLSLALLCAVPGRAEDAAARLDRLVPPWMESLHVPGASIVGIERGQIAWQRHFGIRRAGSPEPVDQNTIFEACSMTKPTFAYVAMKLVERGRLDLDRPLVEYLPRPYLDDEPLHRQITARMVLSHTTGFPNWREGGWQSGKPLSVEFVPGTRFQYSGEGFLYLQRVVEHITQTPAEVYMKRELFVPLGMNHSSYVWEDRFERLAAAGHDERGRVKEGRRLYRRANAGYSLYCSAEDYARFIVEMIKPDRSAGHSLSDRSLAAMFTRTTKATGRKPVSRSGKRPNAPVWWGLGWPIDATDAGDRIYHGGANGTGFRCYAEFDRRRGSGLVIMTNSLGGEDLWRRIVDAISPP